MMNFRDWYTDRMDIFRVQAVQDGSLTRHERSPVLEDIPCRVFQMDAERLVPSQTAASAGRGGQGSGDWVQCANEVDIRPGDELRIRRGAGLGKTTQELRAFAGEPNYYFEPFGAVLPGLAHQEIPLIQEERVK